ncbi:MAG: hypothetical protein ACE5HO_11720 [bacterium]
MKFNIVLVQPGDNTGYPHAQCFTEIAHVLRYGLEDLGHQVILGGRLYKDCVNIVLGYQFFWGKRLPEGYRYVVYQLEELSENEGWSLTMLETLRSPCVVWDFNEQNVQFLADRGIKAICKPIGYHPKMEWIGKDKLEDVDILFYGSLNDRRKRILSRLQNKFDVRVLFGVYGRERDQWISRSKMVLSIYYYETKLFDDVRMSYLMNNKVFTIVEDAPNKKYEDLLVYADYGSLIECCDYYLHHETLRNQIAEKAYHGFKQYPEVEFLQQALSLSF